MRLYAVGLGLLHVITGLSWLRYGYLAHLLEARGVCWPFLPACDALRGALGPELLRAGFTVYIVLGCITAGLFALSRWRPGLLALLAATLLELLLHSLEYRTRSNEVYMFNAALAVFLLAPRQKPQLLQALLACFYLWAGLLKFKAEWISGAALYINPIFIPAFLIPASCVYVLVLETVFIWGLFSNSARVRWLVFLQLLLFHAISWSVVGWHYPLLMFTLLSIYPLVWLREPGALLSWTSLSTGAAPRRSIAITAALFSLLQLPAYTIFPGDSSLTGEGRLFALDMFDTQPICEGGAILHQADGGARMVPLIDPLLKSRRRCDPLVLFSKAKDLCAAQGGGDVVSIDVRVDARRKSDPVLHPLIRAQDFCNPKVAYSIWHHNDWLKG